MKGEFYFVIVAFLLLIVAASYYIYKYIKNKKEKEINNYANDHIFESIPSLFPTLGILLTSIGIIFGLWNFNENKIKASISELLDGIKFSFLATAIGLALLLIFQKAVEYWKRKIEDLASDDKNLQSENPVEIIKKVYSVLENLNKDKANTDTQFKLLQDQNKQLLLIIERLQENQENLTEHIQTGFTDIHIKQTESNNIFTEKSEAIVSQINQGMSDLAQVQKDTNAVFTENSQSIVNQINEGLTNVQTVQAETNKVFTEKSEAIVTQINQGLSELEHAQKETNAVFTQNSQAIVNQINEGLTNVQTVQAETNKVFAEKSEAIVTQINQGLGQLDQAQTESNKVFTENSQAIVNQLNEGFTIVQTVQAETNKVFTETSEVIVSQINQGLGQLDQAQKETNKVFTESSQAIASQVNQGLGELQLAQSETNSIFIKSNESIVSTMNNGFETIQVEVKTSNAKLIEVSENILVANNTNNQLFETKFNEFIILLQENNTKGLVEMMDKATKQFNDKMSDLINNLVQENFAQLNQSVEKLNDWQEDNLENITLLTKHYKETTELFSHSSSILKEVAENTKQLVSDDSKLNEIVRQLNEVMINDEKFGTITNKLSSTVELVEKSTILYEETASKLNKWVVNEYEFKQGVEILINKLEEFKDFNSGVWESYRQEMQTAVTIIKETTTNLNENVENLNAEFYERLSSTLENLDSYIVTLIEREKDEQEG